MKFYNKILIALILVLSVGACTSKFDEINTDPNTIGIEDASAKYFLTELMVRIYIPNRYAYWRGNLIHADRYAGHMPFGSSGSWWNDGLGYSYNTGYTDAAWDHYNGLVSNVKSLLNFTKAGGQFENELTYAVVLILKSHYYQLYTDTFGDIPYSEVYQEGITLPKFDAQKDVYKGIIAELDDAMAIIGDASSTGDADEDLGSNDLFFGGDLQKWKRFANTLKLKIAMRAFGATGDDFASTAITQATGAPLLAEGESALIEKDLEISQWAYSTYGDVWHNFGGFGSKWLVGRELVNYLRDNNDPRLKQYAKPATGGKITLIRPATGEDNTLFPKRAAFLEGVLTEGGATNVMTWYPDNVDPDSVIVDMPADLYYIGQPVRINGGMKPLANYNFFSQPSDLVVAKKNTGDVSTPETVLLSAESFFLQAQAVIEAGAPGIAQTLYQTGIMEAMKIWGVDDGSISTFIATEPMALLNGTQAENLEKIAVQRWIATYTDGYEAWAIVRKTGYPSSLAAGVSDNDIYAPGNITAGAYPQRMRYGSGVATSNPSGYDAAIARQGADLQETKLWYAK